MSKPESLNELHRLGEFVNDQHDGRKDQPVTGADLYNLAVQLDSNFASLRSEIGYLRTDMHAEFKSVRAETGPLRSDMNAEFKAVRAETGSLRSDMHAEFKAVRAETGSLRSDMHAEFKAVRAETGSLRSDMNAEFKAARAEMAEGYAKIQTQISQIPMKAAAWVATTMIGLIGVGAALVAAVIAVV